MSRYSWCGDWGPGRIVRDKNPQPEMVVMTGPPANGFRVGQSFIKVRGPLTQEKAAEIRRQWVAATCMHGARIVVDSCVTGEPLAQLCPDCDAQLPPDWTAP